MTSFEDNEECLQSKQSATYKSSLYLLAITVACIRIFKKRICSACLFCTNLAFRGRAGQVHIDTDMYTVISWNVRNRDKMIYTKNRYHNQDPEYGREVQMKEDVALCTPSALPHLD